MKKNAKGGTWNQDYKIRKSEHHIYLHYQI